MLKSKKWKLNAKRGNGRDDPEAGWTILETLIVLGIILFLTATVGFSAIRAYDKARIVAAKSHLETFELAMQMYFLDCGSYPTQEQGLAALRDKPRSEPVPSAWEGPYLSKQIPKDPWGREYAYLVPGPSGLPFGIATYGADGMEGGEGMDADIATW